MCKNPGEFSLLRRGAWIYHHSLTTSNAISMSQRNQLAPSSSDPCDILTFGLLAGNKAILAFSTLFTFGISFVLFRVFKSAVFFIIAIALSQLVHFIYFACYFRNIKFNFLHIYFLFLILGRKEPSGLLKYSISFLDVKSAISHRVT